MRIEPSDEQISSPREWVWREARSTALRAVLATPGSHSMTNVATAVNAYAHLIVNGELPSAEPGVYWS